MKKNLFKKSLALVMAVALLSTFVPFSAGAATEVDYTIVSPYAAVNWNTWDQYKTNMHTHSTISDGAEDFSAMVERHYELGYDILGMTDHGTVDRGWTKLNSNPFVTFAMNIDTFGSNSNRSQKNALRKSATALAGTAEDFYAFPLALNTMRPH